MKPLHGLNIYFSPVTTCKCLKIDWSQTWTSYNICLVISFIGWIQISSYWILLPIGAFWAALVIDSCWSRDFSASID